MPTLHWLDRTHSLRQSAQVPCRILRANRSLSHGDTDCGNLLIQGDNLHALKALLPYFRGQVKCIFIDPPYNTKSAFEHYQDSLEHSKWLDMMYPRLELLRELLAEDGSIWVTIDDNEAHYLKVMMDEIFGRGNFVANVVWQKVYSERMDAKGFSVSHDHVLIFRKSEKFSPKQIEKEQNQTQFGFYDSTIKKHYRRRSLRKEGSESLRQNRPSMWYAISAPDGTEIWPIKPDGTEGRWRWKKDNVHANNTLLDFVRKDGRWEIYVKQYLEDNPSRPPATFWPSEDVGHNHEAKLEVRAFNDSDVFDTPKPERLIKRVLEIATNPGDIVLDSFLGSGTTAAVAHKMNRRYIGIEMGEHAKTHCAVRLKKVIEGEQGGISKTVNWQGGGGFRFYTLGAELFAADGSIHPEVKFTHLAAYLWFFETRIPWTGKGDSPLLGIHNNTAYYLLYNGILKDKTTAGGNILTAPLLRQLPGYDGHKVIYALGSRLNTDWLAAHAIQYRHIPHQVPHTDSPKRRRHPNK